MTDIDYSNISVNSINCDKCSLHTSNSDNCMEAGADCVWIPLNTEDGGKCVNKCGARLTKGQCEQYHVWNRSNLTPTVYDFSGSDNLCEWHPHAHSIDETVDSKEGDCRPKYFNNDITSSISSCFSECSGQCDDGSCITFKEGMFCIPNELSTLGNVHCGNNYNGHHAQCYLQGSTCSDGCEKYVDERKHSNSDTGICVSDGSVRYDLDTGEELGLIMTDEQCGEITDSEGCMNYRGYGCLWEPFNEYCIPTVPQGDTMGVTIDDMYNACKPIDGHVPPAYDINMIEEEHLNVSEYRDRDNIKYPYITSKYLCDVCHIRNNDLDNMKRMSGGTDEDKNNLKYYMIKKYIDFEDGNTNRSSTIGITPQEYCENEIDDNHEIFNPCVWDSTGSNSSSPKGGNCVSKCSQKSPVDSTTTNSQELKYHKEQCISEKWFPDNSIRGVEFPNIIRGSEADDDYFKDRYCTWDGFECHNSIPCKFAQQTRCEDLGYEWYQGTALDIMNQPNNDNLSLGIPIDLSTSYPIVRKGDGKPVEGDMEGICIYPNTEAGYISTPTDGYMINPEFIGNQVIMIKWREYGSGWWEDMSCKRKINGLNQTMITDEINYKSYFLGENVALIPFRINQGDRCDDIKNAINNALQNYQYFVYNGEWVVHAEDIIHAIDRSYDSSIDENDLSTNENGSISKYQRYYGYMYYSNIANLEELEQTTDFKCTEQVRRHLNVIYDLRGAINILPVLDQHCVLEITNFSIDSNTGAMSLVVETKDDNFDKSKFQFVEFIGNEIFKGGADSLSDAQLTSKLNITVLSKYNYPIDEPEPGAAAGVAAAAEEQTKFLPNNIVQGYGTLYENIRIRNIEKSFLHISNLINKRENDIVNMINNNKYNAISDSFYTDNTQALDTLSTDLNSIISTIRDTVDINDKITSLNNLTNVLDTRLSTIIGDNAELIVVKNELIESMVDLDLDNPPLTHDYDIRNEDEFNSLKEIINLFRPESLEFGYSETDNDDKTPIEYWTVYNEFKNFNVFSQPIITIKDELNKAEYIPNPSTPSLKKLCSGSLESWKIQIEGDSLPPVYQRVDLREINGLLKMMAGYLDDSDEINTDIISGGLIQYIESYQQIDITKCVLWSITRNTPPFWGNLFYNKRNIEDSNNELYGCSGNFNTITNSDEDEQIYGRRNFNYNIAENTLFKPFCEVGGEEVQKILWKNIMSYTGGNKREIQLSRNVSNGNYNNYIENFISTDLTNYTYTNGGTTNRLVVDKINLNTKLNNLLPIINESKKEYVLRSLLDWKRLDYDDPGDSNNCKLSKWKYNRINNYLDEYIQHVFGTSGQIDGNYTSKLSDGCSISTDCTGGKDTYTAVGSPPRDTPRIQGWNSFGLNNILTTTDYEKSTFKNNARGNRAYCSRDNRATNFWRTVWTAGGNYNKIKDQITDQPAGSLEKGGDDYYWGWNTPGDSDNISLSGGFNGWDFTYDRLTGNGRPLVTDTGVSHSCAEFKNFDGATNWINDVMNNVDISTGTDDNDTVSGTKFDNNYSYLVDSTNGLDSRGADDQGEATDSDIDIARGFVNRCCGVREYPECPITPSVNTNLPDNHIFKITDDIYDIDFSNVQRRITEINGLNATQSINKLTHINRQAGYDKPWNDTDGHNFRDEAAIWNPLNENTNIINKLYYPLDEFDGIYPTGGRLPSDNLRAWCMSNSGSNNYIDSGSMLINSTIYSKFNHINPDNPEKNSGILYNNWLNSERDLSTPNNTEIFGKEWSNINAYKYPEICEPWLLKASHDKTKPATYDNSLYWDHWLYLDPLDPNINDPEQDIWRIKNEADDNFGTVYQNNIDNLQSLQTDTPNSLHNMLYPLSITAARPREKIIYIDITPNNNIFDKNNNSRINTYYFNPPANIYQYNNNDSNYFWLHPGLSTNSHPNHKMIIGRNTRDDIPQETPSLENIANHHVAYFKEINNLFNSGKITCSSDQENKRVLDDNNNEYKYSNIMFTVILTNMRENNDITPIFYKNGEQNELDFTNYYNSYLPPKGIDTKSITNDLFGNGHSSVVNNDFVTDNLETTLTHPVVGVSYMLPDAPPVKYFNINMVFPRSSVTEEIQQVNTCKDLIKSKLTICGNHYNWSSQTQEGGSPEGCYDCFDSRDLTNSGICPLYQQYIEGNPNVPDPPQGSDVDDEYYAQRVGVCGILQHNLDNKQPWDFINFTKEPETFGSHLPTSSPYDIENRNCNNLQDETSLKFLTLEHSGLDTVNSKMVDNVNFFKPARSSSSDIFEDSHTTIENTAFGCMRKDLSLMKEDNIKLSCNTNLKTPVERDKHTLINFIIKHDETGTLNSSERTKLAIMSEEELLNKALDLGININYINEYTRPKIQTKVRDTLIPNLCDDGITPCYGEDSICQENGRNYRCGLYEEWNDLQKYYYNIKGNDDKEDFTSRKEWYYIGCGIDLNYSDNSSGESVCKDKYPGLCQQNVDKCNSENVNIREAIHLDCPETCKVQFNSMDQFKQGQSGALSICTSRGRCKWSHDQDPSNLLPLCEENTSRELGSTVKCRNYNSFTDGPETGSCNLKTHPETINSTICAEQRCSSMQGCVFTPQVSRVCTVSGSVDERIINEEDCPEGGRWIGSSIGGQCILPERNYYESDLEDFTQDCNMLGGRITTGSEQSCEYKPDIPYTGEDPCSHIIDLDDLTYDEQLQYFYSVKGNKIYVTEIVPEKLNDANDAHPKYIKIKLNSRLSNDNIDNYGELINMTEFPKNKYIYIDNDSEGSSLCSQYLLGKSKIVKITNFGEGDGNTEIIIGGPNKAYIMPLDINTGKIDIGGENACDFRGLYDLEGYNHGESNSGGLSDDIVKANACYNNSKGACNYEFGTTNCVSCAMYKDEVSCFGNNDIDEFSQCGWGSVKDMCEVIGEMDECVKMHLDGCRWNPATQKCSLNKLTDDDGNPFVDKVGCVKCNDIQHKNTCNSMKNCFWDALTQTPDGVGQCRACSSIRPDENDGIDFPGIKSGARDVVIDYKCDNFQLTQGQCEYRNPINKDTGLENLISGEASIFSVFDRLESFWRKLSLDLSDDEAVIVESECEKNSNSCKCSPTREYPLFPDWIMHNLMFLLIITPFAIYFMIAWYNLLISPSKFISTTGTLQDKAFNFKDKAGNFKDKAGNFKDKVFSVFKKGDSEIVGGAETDEVLNALKKLIDEGTNNSWFSKQADKITNFKIDFSILNTLSEYFDTTVLHLPNGGNVSTDWIDPNFEGKYTKLFSGILNPEFYNPRAQFAEMIPKNDPNFKLKSIATLLKFVFLIVSLPFTIIQYLSRNLRLAPAIRIGYLIFDIAEGVKNLAIGIVPIGKLLHWIIIGLGIIFIIGGSGYLFLAGFKVLKEIIKLGLVPNHNYVDPIDGVTHRVDGKTYPAAAYWPKRGYREEWDDMIKDPVSDEVIKQRLNLLGGSQGDINHEDSVSDVYQMAYLDMEPSSLNWTQWFRDAGKTYNKFINRLGDDFIFIFIISPFILYKYITRVSNYLPIDGNNLDIRSFVIYTIFYAIIFGLISVYMSKYDAVDGEYDGVEAKCYDTESPFKLGNDTIQYPALCFGDSVDDSKNECPYGCYYIGPGRTNPDGSENLDYGKKCKDNRSSLSLGKILNIDSFEPEPTLNIPFDNDGAIPSNWTTITPEQGKSYVCPPTSRFMSVYPYDMLCSPTAKRCKSRSGNDDDICEMLYMKHNYNDTKCINKFTDGGDLYENEEMNKAARGPWDMRNWNVDVDGRPDIGINCELETPYLNYKKDKWCPFPLPAAENEFFSEKTDTRDSISLWNYMYDKIKHPNAVSSCTYDCAEPTCSPEEFNYIETCRNIKKNILDTEDLQTECENNMLPDGSYCIYYPENVPLQTRLQNQERYLIVNQEYGENLFS